MTNPKHTPELWEAEFHEGEYLIYGITEGRRHFTAITRHEGNCKRIVQCVNALKGIENPEAIKELIEAAKDLEETESVSNLVKLSRALEKMGVK